MTPRSTWRLDPAQVRVEFSTPFLFTRVKGWFRQVNLQMLEIDEDNILNSILQVDVDAASLDTGDARRDENLRGPDFLDVVNHPLLSFRSTRVEPIDPTHFRLHGDLTVRGVTRPVVLTTTYNGRGFSPWGGEVAGYSASATLDRRDFGITWNTGRPGGGLMLSDQLDVTVDVQPVRVT